MASNSPARSIAPITIIGAYREWFVNSEGPQVRPVRWRQRFTPRLQRPGRTCQPRFRPCSADHTSNLLRHMETGSRASRRSCGHTSVILSGTADVRGSSNLHPPREAIAEIRAPFVLARHGSETKLIIVGESRPDPEPDRVLVKAVAQAHRWWRDLQEQRYLSSSRQPSSTGTKPSNSPWIGSSTL
jgi:hypothetical protein